MVNRKITKIEISNIVIHLFTCSSGIFLLKIDVFGDPLRVLKTNEKTTIIVFTLIPPAVEADAPPININAEHHKTVGIRIELKSIDDKLYEIIMKK